MCDLARDAGILNLVNFEFRYHPIRGKLRNLILDGAAGKVEHVQWTSFMGWWRNPSRRYGWIFDASRGGGWVRAAGAHCIDYLRWTFGEIVDASADIRTTIPERPDAEGAMQKCTAEDGFTATMRTEQDVWANLDLERDRRGRLVFPGDSDRQRGRAGDPQRQRARDRRPHPAAHGGRDFRAAADRTVGERLGPR